MDLPLTGIEIVDEEHLKLAIKIMALTSLKDIDGILDMCDFVNEVIIHFTNENLLMERYGYPEFQHHYDVHKTKIRELLVLKDLDKDLLSWFLNHIVEEDIPMAKYLLKYSRTP